ncbi:pancreatic lipase-related protein 2 [Caerostris extrusa]|uniref:Pancreatic lipase-related protein 2 n=1 Tax=Caerostris extrusa TaxID=172846 RepID=A0AAV4M5L5_CAEEX|nr:pancreatic lipase-related protein 2 [Caerostris extrusa]
MVLDNTDSGLERHTKTGNLLFLLRGQRKPLFVPLRFYSMHSGKEYTFLVTSSINIGEIQKCNSKMAGTRTRRPVEVEFCKSNTVDEPGWMTYYPNCN